MSKREKSTRIEDDELEDLLIARAARTAAKEAALAGSNVDQREPSPVSSQTEHEAMANPTAIELMMRVLALQRRPQPQSQRVPAKTPDGEWLH